MVTSQLKVNLPLNVHERLRDLSAHLNVTQQTFLRQALKVKLEEFAGLEVPAVPSVAQAPKGRIREWDHPSFSNKTKAKRRQKLIQSWVKRGPVPEHIKPRWQRYCAYYEKTLSAGIKPQSWDYWADYEWRAGTRGV